MKNFILTLIVLSLSIFTSAYADNDSVYESTFNRDSAYEAFSKRSEIKNKATQVEVEQRIIYLYEQHNGTVRSLMTRVYYSSMVMPADSAGRIWTLIGDVALRDGSSSEEEIFYIRVKLASGITGHYRRFITYDKDCDEYKQTNHVWFTPVESTSSTIFIWVIAAFFAGVVMGKKFL